MPGKRSRCQRSSKNSYEHTVSERVFQAHVIQTARLNGFRVAREDPLQPPLDLIMHIHDSRKSQGVGFPDLVLCRPGADKEPGRLILAELKSEKGRLRPEQKLWLSALKTCPGVEVYVWKPSQMDEVVQVLGGYDSRLFA